MTNTERMKMKALSKKIDQHDLLSAISTDFHYPTIDHCGRVSWKPSRILSHAFISRFSIEEALCHSLKHSAGEAFLLDKTLTDTAIRKEFPVGKSFYAWAKLGYNVSPQNYEMAEHSSLLNDTASKLGLASHLFAQYDPLCIIHHSGLHLGELINACGRRVHEQLSKKSFKETAAQRKRELSSLMARTERYIDRLTTNHPCLVAFRFELCYTPEHAYAITLEETAAHLSAFIDAIHDDDSAVIRGFWWKRCYLPEYGFGHHFILFIDAGTQLDAFKHWHSTTCGKGFAVFLLPLPGNYRSWGSGQFSGSSQFSMEQVAHSLCLMLSSERYLRLARHHKHEHCGMGELPPIVQRDQVWAAAMTKPLI